MSNKQPPPMSKPAWKTPGGNGMVIAGICARPIMRLDPQHAATPSEGQTSATQRGLLNVALKLLLASSGVHPSPRPVVGAKTSHTNERQSATDRPQRGSAPRNFEHNAPCMQAQCGNQCIRALLPATQSNDGAGAALRKAHLPARTSHFSTSQPQANGCLRQTLRPAALIRGEAHNSGCTSRECARNDWGSACECHSGTSATI